MHYDTKILICLFVLINLTSNFCQHADHQSFLSLIEFNRGGHSTNLIFSSPHGGFLGPNITFSSLSTSTNNQSISLPLWQLPKAGCYNHTLERCIYAFKDCLKYENDQYSYRTDARCIIDRSSTLSMYELTKYIATIFSNDFRPYTILNKLTRQYVDPVEDLPAGTFLLESATRSYIDYHRFIAMAKEAIRPPNRGLFIEFVFHKSSQAIQLGYGFDPLRSSMINKPNQTTINELLSRSGPSVIVGNRSFAYFLRRNGFLEIIPFEQQKQMNYRLSTYSTRMHADHRFNAILFSYPIERLRFHSIKYEALRIAKAIEQFIQINQITRTSTSSTNRTYSFLVLIIFHFFISI